VADRTGIILAAGFGSRLADAGSLKPLTLVAGVPLLLRAVHSMEKAGCARIVVVVGHGKDDVMAGLAGYRGASEIIFADNPRHDLANGVSVLAARPHVKGDFVLAMADHVVGDEVMALARSTVPAPGTAVLLVDYKLDTIFDMDDATKVLAQDGRIDRIGKAIPEYNCVDCGVFICSQALMDAIAAVYDAKGDASLSHGVQALAERGNMLVADIGDGFWQDVDTPAMLAHAEAEFARRQ
jgi:1L-myo-inositol 1-phosphate cytidylyltransferase